jgi:hypothetical protein
MAGRIGDTVRQQGGCPVSGEDPTPAGTRIAEEVGVTPHRISAVVFTALVAACGGSTHVVTLPDDKPAARPLAELWVEPGVRDLFHGVGGARLAPAKDAHYRFKAKDDLGFSVSYDVEDPAGLEWSAKIGAEAQTEVVVSRVLWGLGYHQPPLYYLPSWTLVEEGGDVKKESEARFRPKVPELDRLDELWSWNDNPYVGTRQFKALLVVLLMLNSTDLKDDNNSLYEVKGRLPHAPAGAKRWFVVRDLGAALGETGRLYPRRNWIEGFEKEPFINGVSEGRIEFAYSGRHQQLLKMVTPADLRWAATRMQRLSDKQWHDAFRAANYGEGTRDRYLRKIRQKIDEALKVAASAQATPDV